jgi:flagellar biosynthesis/type III secretory pathway protein FliH
MDAQDIQDWAGRTAGNTGAETPPAETPAEPAPDDAGTLRVAVEAVTRLADDLEAIKERAADKEVDLDFVDDAVKNLRELPDQLTTAADELQALADEEAEKAAEEAEDEAEEGGGEGAQA